MSGEPSETIVIIGAGQGAVQTIQDLRRHKYAGQIILVGLETALPYQRPPLSKAYLKGEFARDRLFLKPEKFYSDRNVEIRTGLRATKIVPADKTVQLGDGSSLTYDKLVIATGSTPRTLPVESADLAGVFTLRSLADTDAIQARMENARDVVVIGGGYIGLECAATARQLGKSATVVERLPRVLARVTSPEISSFFDQLHASEGVAIRYEVGLKRFVGDTSGVTGVELDTGETLPADLVIVGIGVTAADGLAADAGLTCDDGIIVDDNAQTSDPNIYAVGDCTRRTVDGYDGQIRLESVHNAQDQGIRAAAHIAGVPCPPTETPWFWSDQFHIKLQTVGLFNGYTDVVIRGSVEDEKFAAFYFKDGALCAVDAVNDPPSFMAGKQIFKLGMPFSMEEAADTEMSLKDRIKAFKAQNAD